MDHGSPQFAYRGNRERQIARTCHQLTNLLCTFLIYYCVSFTLPEWRNNPIDKSWLPWNLLYLCEKPIFWLWAIFYNELGTCFIIFPIIIWNMRCLSPPHSKKKMHRAWIWSEEDIKSKDLLLFRKFSRLLFYVSCPSFCGKTFEWAANLWAYRIYV